MNITKYLGEQPSSCAPCWSFVRTVYKNELNITLNRVAVSAINTDAVIHECKTNPMLGWFKAKTIPQALDVVAMCDVNDPQRLMNHVGIYIEPDLSIQGRSGYVLHALENHVVCTPINRIHECGKSITQFYRYPSP